MKFKNLQVGKQFKGFVETRNGSSYELCQKLFDRVLVIRTKETYPLLDSEAVVEYVKS